MIILKDSGWSKRESPEVSLRFKILAATEKYDQEIDDFNVEQLENCCCKYKEDLCAKCQDIFAIEEYFNCVGYEKLFKQIPLEQITTDTTLIVNGHMEWQVHYNDGSGYDDHSQFIITNYYIEQ